MKGLLLSHFFHITLLSFKSWYRPSKRLFLRSNGGQWGSNKVLGAATRWQVSARDRSIWSVTQQGERLYALAPQWAHFTCCASGPFTIVTKITRKCSQLQISYWSMPHSVARPFSKCYGQINRTDRYPLIQTAAAHPTGQFIGFYAPSSLSSFFGVRSARKTTEKHALGRKTGSVGRQLSQGKHI